MDDLAPARYEMLADAAAADTLQLRLSGSWRLSRPLPPAAEVESELERRGGVRRIVIDAQGLTGWDSGLLMFLRRLDGFARGAGLETDASGLPEGVRRLLSLAAAVPERAGARRGAARESFLARVGRRPSRSWQASREVVVFLGEVTLAFGRLLARPGALSRLRSAADPAGGRARRRCRSSP